MFRGNHGRQRPINLSWSILLFLFMLPILLLAANSLANPKSSLTLSAMPPTSPIKSLIDIDVAPRTSGISHAPIFIFGDGDFSAGNGVVHGTGTPGDPYVIANWTISGQPAGAAIYISSTSAYCVIRNCTIIGAEYGDPVMGETAFGIRLEGVGNLTVEHNSFTSPGRVNYDIYVNGGLECEIRENAFLDAGGGIDLVYGTTQVTVTENLFLECHSGVCVTDCSGVNAINNNQLINMNGYIAVNYVSGRTTISGNTCTTNSSRTQMPGSGILISGSNHTVITGNTCSFVKNGIEALDTYNMTITGNFFEDNAEYGVWLGRWYSPCVLTEVAYNYFARNLLGCVIDEDGAKSNIHDNICNPEDITSSVWILCIIVGSIAGIASWFFLRKRQGELRPQKMS